MDKRFLFYYVAGARGDFLANILMNEFLAVDPMQYKLPTPPGVVKAHDLKFLYEKLSPTSPFEQQLESFDHLFDYCATNNLISIRILIENISDAVDAHYLHVKKNNNANWDKENDYHWSTVDLETDRVDLNYRGQYNHVITFRNLFDVEFLRDFYFKIHKKQLSDRSISNIITNINLQDIPSKTKIYE